MQLTITIEMDNAAFEFCNGTEAARILRRLADSIDADTLEDGDRRPLGDANGNLVGAAWTTA